MSSIWIAHDSKREDASINLICFPFPGGSASYYANWTNCFSEDINVCPVLYPKREKRRKELMPESIIALAEEFVNSNTELFDKPFAVFGYCAGSVIAYEVIRYVYRLKEKQPEFFFVASANAPEFAATDSMVKDSNLNDNDMFIKYIKDNKIFDESFINNPLFYNYYFPILKEDYILLSSYDYDASAEKFDFNIYAVYGAEDHRVSEEKIKCWEACTNGQVSIEKYPGDHFFVNDAYKEICSKIEKIIKENY